MPIPLEELDRSEGEGSAAYRDYYDALARILADDPEDMELDVLREEDGRVKATFLNIGALAGRKANRIMGRNSPFKVLTAYIHSLQAEHGVSLKTTERLKRQAEDIATLVQRLKAVRSRLAESVLVRDDLTKRLATAEDDLRRARAKRN
jgi:hypothetical protein